MKHALPFSRKRRAPDRCRSISRRNPMLAPRALRLEPLEERCLLDASAWTNPNQPLDVNADGFITPLDALLVINRLNAVGPHELPPVSPGVSPPPYYDTSGNGALAAQDVLLVLNRLNADRVGPAIVAGLLNDTGPGGLSNDDGITTDPTIAGAITDFSRVLTFTARVDGSEPSSILSFVDDEGLFVLSRSTLEAIRGAPLEFGPFSVRFDAMDELSHSRQLEVTYTLIETDGPAPVPQLAPESDTGASSSDNVTADNTPTILVPVAPGTHVRLLVDGVQVGETVANPTASFDLGPLDDGVYAFTAQIVDPVGGPGDESDPLLVTIHTVAPEVSLFMLPTINDITPLVTVSASSTLGLPNGTAVSIDVDLDDDGEFTEGEIGYATGTLFEGVATFEVRPALPLSDPEVGPYAIAVRARVEDLAGNVGSDARATTVDTIPSDALKDYVEFDDGMFSYSLAGTINGFGYTAYVLDVTSQQWRSFDDVSRSIWQHWVTVIVPNGPISSTALLAIGGGSTQANPPTGVNSTLAQAAVLTQSVIIDLPNVPNQPIFFTDEEPPRARTEDEIIAYTFDKFLADTSQTDWPLLLPMVKSAVKTMDAVQEFVPTVASGQQIDDFVVTGASKRGWTTWLTAAADDRVRAMIPMVIDVLNLDEQMLHHYGVYGFFSPAIGDYLEMNIFERILTPEGQELGRIIDPYHYIHAGRYDIPKLLINSTGDEFFVTDSGQFYMHDLPGETHVRYIPNTGHGLDDRAATSILTFFASVLVGAGLPEYSWTVQPDGSIHVQTTDTPTQVRLWQATNPDARDFRRLFTGINFTSSVLAPSGDGLYIGDVPMPVAGARAYFVELTYPSLVPGMNHVFTTEVRVKSTLDQFDWPYAFPDEGGGGGSLALPSAAPLVTQESASGWGLAASGGGDLLGLAAGMNDASGLAALVSIGPSDEAVAPLLPTSGTSAVASAVATAGTTVRPRTPSAAGADRLFASEASIDELLAGDLADFEMWLSR